MRDKKSNASKGRMKDSYDAMKPTKGKSGKAGRKKEETKTRGKSERYSEKREDSKRKSGRGFAGKTEGRQEGTKPKVKQDKYADTREESTGKLGKRENTNSGRRKEGTRGKPVEKRGFSQKRSRTGLSKARGRKPSGISPLRNDDGSIRLNRYISNSGVCSRREADEFIAAGLVTVNGKMVTELGLRVSEDDVVKFDGRKLNPEKKVYVLLNKPKNFVTTTDDPHADKIVMDLVRNACPERIYPVGRLDRNTTGVLLFTNDGDLSKRLTHPSYMHKKVYHVSLDKPLTKQHMLEIANGIELEDGPISSDEISYIAKEDKTEVGIEIHSGRNRLVRRVFEHFGYHVKRLDRVYFAGLTKKNLPRGKWRILDKQEVAFLKMNR